MGKCEAIFGFGILILLGTLLRIKPVIVRAGESAK
jgi:hypothetical protein